MRSLNAAIRPIGTRFCAQKWIFIILALIIILLSAHRSRAEAQPHGPINSAALDITDFCDQNTLGALRSPFEMGEAEGSFVKESGGRYFFNRDEILQNLAGFTPWDIGLFPDKILRAKTYRTEDDPILSKRFMVSSIQEFKRALITGDLSKLLDPTITDPQPFEILRNQTDTQEAQAIDNLNFAKRLALCSDISILGSLECQSGLARILAWGSPISVHGAPLTNLETFEAVLTRRNLIEGVRRTALKIITRFENEVVDTNSSLYDDLVNSFLETGLSRGEAEDGAWMVIAVIASSGPNLGERLAGIKVEPEFQIMEVALSALALSILELDFISRNTGHLYSLPRSIRTTCDNGKPYHFWMTAYYARRLVKEGFRADAAATSAFIVQKGYEMVGTSGDRDPDWSLKTDTFSAWNNMIRIDLAYSSAGAVFGATFGSKNQPTLSIDEGIVGLLRAAKDIKGSDGLNWAMSPAASYLTWKKKFAPDAALALNLLKAKTP